MGARAGAEAGPPIASVETDGVMIESVRRRRPMRRGAQARRTESGTFSTAETGVSTGPKRGQRTGDRANAVEEIRFCSEAPEDKAMKSDPKKWNPFKFLRGDARRSEANSSEPLRTDGTEQWRGALPNIARLFARDPWRAVEEFFHDPFAGSSALERWFGDFSSSRFQPRIDVVDEGPVLRVTAELPGMEREDVKVSVEDGSLVLRGEKKQDVRGEENGCYRLERAYGRFVRTIPMPEYSDPGRALAKFDNGVLTLTVPKTEPAPSTSCTIDIG